jgi:hypothetical protein
MTTWNRDDTDLSTLTGIASTTVGSLRLTGTTIGHISDTDILAFASNSLTITASDLHINSDHISLKDGSTEYGDLVKSGSNLSIRGGENGAGNIAFYSGGGNIMTMATGAVQIGGTIQCTINSGDGSSENFVVEQSGLLLKRTAAEVRSDLGISDNEIIDWTTGQGSTDIHQSNIPWATGQTFDNDNQGLVPSPGATGTTVKYLREDGSWIVPPDTQPLSTEQVQDIVGAMFSGNTETNTAVTYQDADGTIDVVTTLDGAPLTTEAVQDIVGAMFTSNTETRIAATYEDGDGTIDLVVDDMTANTQLTSEEVQDIVGAMFTSNTETRISATYEDGDGTIDLVVDDMTANTQLSTEEVQDIVGAMFSGNTETRISATYEDGDGTVDLVVDDMSNLTGDNGNAAIYDNSGTPAFKSGITKAEVLSLLNVADGAEVNVNADWNSSSGDSQISNKPTLVTALNGLSDVTYSSGDLTISGLDKIISGSLDFDSSGHINFDGCAAGFTRTTYADAADVEVDFTTGNKAHLDMTGGSITGTLTLKFPAISGNFVLVVQQDGSTRTINAYATKDAAGNAGNNDGGTAGAVRWAGGGTAPDLTDGGNKRDILSFYWDATEEVCYGVASLNF